MKRSRPLALKRSPAGAPLAPGAETPILDRQASKSAPGKSSQSARIAKAPHAAASRKALRLIARLRAAAEEGIALTAWEQEFLASLEQRLREYGSAFRDPAKGRLEDALSALQGMKVREIRASARQKTKSRKISQNPQEAQTPDGGETAEKSGGRGGAHPARARFKRS